MKILKTPWKNDLLELAATAKQSIKITSPFVKKEICNEIIDAKIPNVTFELITCFKLINIYTGSLDLSALENILSVNGVIKNCSRLHSKIYLFDCRKAIITSGNLTTGGVLKNYEYGLLIDNESLVSQINKDFIELSNNKNTGIIKSKDLRAVRNILTNIAKLEAIKLPSYSLNIVSSDYELDVLEISIEKITRELSGWKLDIFNCLNNIPTQRFTITDVYSFENYLKNKHPLNNNVKDKIRQQLQALRDLGLVEFSGYGNYRKLWKQKEKQ